MVDINLLGEEENSEDRPREDSFAKTVSLDEPYKKFDEEEPASFTKQEPVEPRPFARETAASSFSRRAAEYGGGDGSSRTKAYFIVLGLILMALTAVFFLFPRDRKKTDRLTVAKPSVEENLETAEGNVPDSLLLNMPGETPSTTTEPPQTDAPLAEAPPTTTPARGPDISSTLSPLERQQLSSTKLAVSTVRALANSLSGANDFTLITYHGNHSFFAEFRANSSQESGSVAEMLRQRAGAVAAKTVSQSETSANGSSFSKALVKGDMDPQAGNIMLTGSVQPMNLNDFTAWIQQQGESNRLSLKRLSTGSGSGAGVPIQVHFAGANRDVMAFLNTLENANINVSVYKIILSPTDRRSLSTDSLDLVLQLEM